MSQPAMLYSIDDVIARIRELGSDGVAPSLRTYNAQRGPGLPCTSSLHDQGYEWLDLVALAELEPAKRGGPKGNRNRSSADFAAIDAEIAERIASAEPPRPHAWPLAAIQTRTEVKIGQLPDGTPVRVTRRYYSLR